MSADKNIFAAVQHARTGFPPDEIKSDLMKGHKTACKKRENEKGHKMACWVRELILVGEREITKRVGLKRNRLKNYTKFTIY